MSAPAEAARVSAVQRARRGASRFPLWFAAGEGVRAALHSIRAHAFRSFLTTLGIVIGVAAVIGMVSIIQGLNFAIGEQLQGLGSNSITIQAYTPYSERLQGRIARLTNEDLELIRYRVDGVESVTPIMFTNLGGQVRYGSQTTGAQILGTTYSYRDIGQRFNEAGRFISASDDETRRRVAVIGEDVREDLALPSNPVGEFLQINGEWIKIVGLLEATGDILGQSQDNQIILPYSTMQSLAGNRAEPNIQIALTVTDLTEMDIVVQRIERLLRDAHDLDPGADDDFQIQTAEQLTESIDEIFTTVTLVMGGIVGISLLVGGIGIMNIMLVSVTERTREIGICKAIGAKRHHILFQFLLEAFALCLFGGLIGLAIGYGIGVIAAAAIPGMPPAHTPLWAIGLALGFSGAVGVVFGILPAAKAANLDPISSLRYE